ncbi:MAG TPA: cyclase family protein [Candidatus Saccharimonadales bacterium]|nr:cyclase family protein [Candidatus Saccharimonadales bacterium]
MKIHDISPPVSINAAVWPGDVPLSLRPTMSRERGDAVNVTEIRATVHLGAHADAPLHFLDRGADIAHVPLEAYLGPARVFDVGEVAEIRPEDLAGVPWAGTERLLLRTCRRFHATQFDEGFPHLGEGLGGWLAARGLKLVGVDVPSVDAFDSRSMSNHVALLRGGVAILENLDLSHVEPGEYELLAAPLKLVGVDASPVRAVLIER